MLNDLRETIDALEKIMADSGLNNSTNKKLIIIQNHIRAAKDVVKVSTNERVVAKWLIVLTKDYDRFCHHIMHRLTR